MATLKIFTYPGSLRTAKALIAAEFAGVDVDVPEDFQMGVTNKTEEFLKLNPMGKVPTAVAKEGPIFESSAIALHVARMNRGCGLLGQNEYERSLVDQWMYWSACNLSGPIADWVYPILGYGQFNKGTTEKAKKTIGTFCDMMNTYLKDKTFFVGEQMTLADIELVCDLMYPFRMVFDIAWRKQYPHLVRWFDTCVNQQEFINVLGVMEYCAKMQAVEFKKKEKKGKKEEKKEKKEEGAAAAAADAEPAEEKKRNPLDLLPPTPFVLDEWKRKYSNESDTRGVAQPWFWEHLDKEGWSLWMSEYKFTEDIASDKLYRLNNLIGGFLQRLDRLRKYGFSSLIIFGAEGSYSIGGCWLFRGQEIPEEMKACDDSELYTWTKCDIEKDKELIDDYFCWDGKLGGKTFAAGKVFK